MTLLVIVIPTYNSSNDIRTCIESVEKSISHLLNTNIVNVLVKDGISTDETFNIVTSMTNGRPWLSIVSTVDSGVYDAMNQAVCISDSKWIYFLGADDKLEKGFDKAISIVKTDISDSCVHYFNVCLKSNNKIYDGQFSKLKLLRKNICHQGVIYPRELLKSVGYNQKYKSLSDWVVNIILFDYFKFHNVVIAQYNDISGLSKEYRDLEFIKDKPCIFKNAHGHLWFFCAIIFSILGRFKSGFR